ncbi:MAG: LysR family transcriptional regulator [Eubacteriales bacterium]|nr:LysR family transcriptional regulator [Eubacteriales bacterium]
MDISFDYYKIFYEVARAKSISQAAQKLCLTQPTVSKYVQNLEQELHCRLFVRSKKGVALTPEGQLLLRQVSRAVQQMDRAGELLQEFADFQSGKINIGASELTMRYFLLPYLERFRRQYPNVNLKIHSFSTPVSVSALSAGSIDFAVSTTPIEGAEHFFVTPVEDFQDIVIAGNQYIFLQGKRLSLKELSSYPLVCMEKGTTTRRFWDGIFKNCGLELHPSVEVNSNDLIPPTVLHNLGIGFVPYKFARAYLESEELFQLELDIPVSRRGICIVQNPQHLLPPAAKALLHMLTSERQGGTGSGCR